MLILTALEAGPMRNGALMRRIGGISQKMLTQSLRDLERNGLVARIDRGSVPRHVSYAPIRFPDDSFGTRISQPARHLSEAEIRIAKQSTGFRMSPLGDTL